MTRAARWIAAGALALAAACGDDGGKQNPDANDVDAPVDVDAPTPVTTLTTYVIDLVEHQTASNTDARPFSEFSDLDDPDVNVPDAYAALFP